MMFGKCNFYDFLISDNNIKLKLVVIFLFYLKLFVYETDDS